MHSINSIVPGAKLEVLTQKASEVLSSLQQTGLFRAIVIERSGQHVLLDTAFGKITGKASAKASANLQKGDELLARISAGKSGPAVKIEQHTPRLLNLPRQTLNHVLNHNVSLPAVARVLSHQAKTSDIQVLGQTLRLPKIEPFQAGQRVLLQAGSQQQLEIRNLPAENILKTALTRLVPENLKNTSGNNLSTLQKLAFEIQHGKTEQLLTRLAAFTASKADLRIPAGAGAQSLPPNVNKVGAETPSNPSSNNLNPLLQKLAAPLARLEGIRPQSISQMLVLLALLKPTASQHATRTNTPLQETLLALISQLKASPDEFDRLIRQIFQHNAGANPRTITEQLPQLTGHLRNELITQAEQSVNQLLTQKTSLGLQIEQNQPLQINLNIPMHMKDEVRNLKLRIQQKKQQEQSSQQHWEIQLSFDFALLGMISTHILLQDSCLSAHFRAQHQETSDLINAHMHEFKNQLADSGFELGLFECQQGLIPEQDEPAHLPDGENLVDVKV